MCKTTEERSPTMVCYDPRHEGPCWQPCEACEEECDPKYLVEDDGRTHGSPFDEAD